MALTSILDQCQEDNMPNDAHVVAPAPFLKKKTPSGTNGTKYTTAVRNKVQQGVRHTQERLRVHQEVEEIGPT